MRSNWTCPFCKYPSTLGDDDVDFVRDENYTDSADGNKSLRGRFTVCPNPDCKKLSLFINLFKAVKDDFSNLKKTDEITHSWQLIPESTAKVYSSETVPQAIIDDYEEACKIVNLSPKAAATLARRALQGMIRDFWEIKKPEGHRGLWTLKNEIEEIESQVDPDVWKAIDSVRNIGNIGAHMEQDVNLVINVEPREASKLIELIELLIEEWYINRRKRQLRLDEIQKIAEVKKSQRPTSTVKISTERETTTKAS